MKIRPKKVEAVYKYFRITGIHNSEMTGRSAGIFNYMLYLANAGEISDEDAVFVRESFRDINHILTLPPQYRDGSNVVVMSFFKAESFDRIIEFMNPVINVLEKNHKPYFFTWANYLPGEVVYEDEFQVCVELPPCKVIPCQEFDPTGRVSEF